MIYGWSMVGYGWSMGTGLVDQKKWSIGTGSEAKTLFLVH